MEMQVAEDAYVTMTDLTIASISEQDSDAASLVAALRSSDAQRLVKGRRLQNIVADVFSLSDSPGDAEITAIAYLTQNSKATVIASFNRIRTNFQGVLKAAKQKMLQQKQQQSTLQGTSSTLNIAAAPKQGGPPPRPGMSSAVAEIVNSEALQNHPEAWQKQQDRLGNCLDMDGSIGQAPHMSGMFIKAIQVRILTEHVLEQKGLIELHIFFLTKVFPDGRQAQG